MNIELRSILPSVVFLGVAAAIALFLTFNRGWAERDRTRTRRAVQIALVAILSQAVHFSEELSTGFYERFPALFGLPPMSLRFFVSFNLAWLVIWSLCAWGLATRRRAALFPLWFLGIASIANGIAHPSFSVLAGGYFPGLVTSPVVGILGVLLLQRLLLLTRPADSPAGAA